MATEALIERLRRAASPCFRRQLAAAGIEPARLVPDDLERLPRLSRGSLDVDALDDPVGEIRLTDAPSPVRLGVSGLPGATVVLSWTARDLARTASRGAGMLQRAGLLPGMRVANTLEGGFATPGSLVLGDALEALGALDVPLGPVRDERSVSAAVDLLERVGVEAVVVDAGTAPALLASFGERIPAALRRIVGVGIEPLPVNLPIATSRWVSVPEVSVFAASSCERGVLHLDPDLRVEVEGGQLILGMPEGDTPLFRLDTGVWVEAVLEGCSCGDGGFTLRERKTRARI